MKCSSYVKPTSVQKIAHKFIVQVSNKIMMDLRLKFEIIFNPLAHKIRMFYGDNH